MNEELIERYADRLVNLSISIYEQSGDTLKFLKAKRFIEELFQSQHQKMTKEVVDIIYEASNRFGVKDVIEMIEKELNIKVEK